MRITREFLFEEGAFFPSCHASTVLSLENGTVLCAYFAGFGEGFNEEGIWLSRKVNNIWQDPVCIQNICYKAHWNPVLMPIDGGIRLIFKVGFRVPLWESYTCVSYDEGLTWSKAEPVEGRIDAGPVRNKPLILKDGTYLAPGSTETETEWIPWVGISNDEGRSYPETAYIPLERADLSNAVVNPDIPVPKTSFTGKGAIQPTLWQTDDGTVHAFMRTTEGRIFRSDSFDLGHTWTTAVPTELPNNNSGIDLTRVGDSLYLVLNPVGANWGDRTPLCVYKGDVNGENFKEFAVLENILDDPKIPNTKHDRHGTAEFSYPAIVASGNTLHISYTFMRRRICYRKIEL